MLQLQEHLLTVVDTAHHQRSSLLQRADPPHQAAAIQRKGTNNIILTLPSQWALLQGRPHRLPPSRLPKLLLVTGTTSLLAGSSDPSNQKTTI